MIEQNDLYGISDIQLSLLKMLKDFDLFCRNNKIQYSIDGGTLLGAIRHQGFIPWDDDVDIMFDRENYTKFIKLSEEFLPKEYEIIGNTWVKRLARKDNPNKKDEQGCIDLFIWDNIPDNALLSRVKTFVLLTLQGMLKEDIDYSTYSIKGKILVIATHFLGLVFPTKTKQKWYDGVSQWGNKKKTKKKNIYNAFYQWLCHFSYESDIMEHISNMAFEDTELMGITDYDRYLTASYGDYMKLPPEDQRIPKHKKTKN